MKKTLLSLAALALSASAALANETSFVFDGEGNVGDLTRVTTVPTEADCVKDFSITTNGVECSFITDVELATSDGEIRKTTGKGLALYSDPKSPANSGLYISNDTNTQITLTVPNGTINGVKIWMTGYATGSLDINFLAGDSKTTELPKSENAIYYWTWTDKTGAEKVTIQIVGVHSVMPQFDHLSARYVHSIDVTYTPDLQGKKEAGLSFNKTEAEVVMTKDNTLPVLSNPNKLPVTWSSTNEAAATVNDKGEVTLVGGGKTFIIASTAGNDEFASQDVRYELTVIPVANSIKELSEVAPALYDKVFVNFPLTVTFCNLSFAFVIDNENNASYIHNVINDGSTSQIANNIYNVGDVIPAGWIATNSAIYGEPQWDGLPGDVTENVEVVYPVVEKITKEDCDRVVILSNVTFTTQTPGTTNRVNGTTPDGSSYRFENPYDIEIMPAGTYDVTCVVRYIERGSTIYFFLTPIAYSRADVEPEFPEEFDVTVSAKGAEVEQEEMFGLFTVMVTGKVLDEEITITLALPEGWDGFLVLNEDDVNGGIGGGPEEPDGPALLTRADYGWESVESMEEKGFTKGNSLTFPVDDDAHAGMMYLYKGDKAYQRVISVESEVSKDLSAISSIASDMEAPRYFNLQGVETDTPANGVYVKVAGGKASKVIVK